MEEPITAAGLGLIRGITRYQWMVVLMAWLGCSLDSTDFNLFALVLRPAVTDRLGGTATAADIGRVGGIFASKFSGGVPRGDPRR